MTCDAWDVVTVPFPFTDLPAQKRRPALVLSQKSFNRQGHTIMAMITSATTAWPSDSPLSHPEACGLTRNCSVRLKLFTLDNRLILRRIGRLVEDDQHQVAAALRTTLPPL